MDSILFHLETIADEDLQEIASSLNLAASRTRAELISDILQHYTYLENGPNPPAAEATPEPPRSRRRTRSGAATNEETPRQSTGDAALLTRAVHRLDHPSCPRRSRNSVIHLDEHAASNSRDPRINLRSVLRRWEAIGMLEERRRSTGSTDSSEDPVIVGRSSRLTLSPGSIEAITSSTDTDTARGSSGRWSSALESESRPSRGSTGSTASASAQSGTVSNRRMSLRSQATPQPASAPSPNPHPMGLRQRRLAIFDTPDVEEIPVTPPRSTRRNQRVTDEVSVLPHSTGRAAGRGGRQSRGRRSTAEGRSSLTSRAYEPIGTLSDSETEIWLDIEASGSDASLVGDEQIWDVISIHEEEEEEDDDFDDYGLDIQEIRNSTVEGRFQIQKKSQPEGEGRKSGTTGTGESSAEPKSCPICLEAFAEKERIRTLPCFHVYHVRCIDRWLKRNAKCPICKHSVA